MAFPGVANDWVLGFKGQATPVRVTLRLDVPQEGGWL
jgi:hypothetical protein